MMPLTPRARSASRRQNDRLAAQKLARDARAVARLAEVPQLALDAISLYRAEVAKRRERGQRVLRSIDEYRDSVPIYYGEPR